MNAPQVLIVEDDPKTQDLICRILSGEGYRTRSTPSIFGATSEVHRLLPDLIILDRRLSDGDGLELCRQLRALERTRYLPILFLTSKNTAIDRVLGLKIGGDDYLSKPFHSEELLARVEALMRRSRAPEEPPQRTLSAHGILLDLDRHECRVKNKVVDLWPKEFELLKILMERAGRLLSKEFLSERIWAHEAFASSRAIDTAVQRLRRKLGPCGDCLETVKGYGYRLTDDR
jgi:DNA-binding response OmpR family regulator